jgi:hypothetical protein
MSTEVQVVVGACATHGDVDATRELPRITFPPMITAIRRAIAKRRPYRCPHCGAPVDV